MYLSCEDEAEVVVLATKILARLLVVHGISYNKKFSEKNGGYTILKHHLKRWWNIPILWPICFSIFFGRDIALLDLDRPFDTQRFLDTFVADGELVIVYPEMLPVIMEMLKSGLRSTLFMDGKTDGQDVPSGNTPDTGGQTAACSLAGESPSQSAIAEMTMLLMTL